MKLRKKSQFLSGKLIPLLGVLLLVTPLWNSQPTTAQETIHPSLYQQEKAKEPVIQVKNELLIIWKTASQKRQTAALSLLQDQPTPVIDSSRSVAPQVSLIKLKSETDRERVMKQLAKNPDIRSVEPNQMIHISSSKSSPVTNAAIPNDPLYQKQWALPVMHVPEGWSKLTPSRKTVTVAVIDTGVDLNHPDLVANLLPGKDYVDQDNTPLDLHGHGTHVSGIIAAIADNSLGISGLTGTADVKILPLKVLDSNGYGTVAAEVQAIYDAVAMGADVINLSLGSSEDTQAEKDAVHYAAEHGVIVVAATGNEYSSVDYPAAYPETIAVAATDSSDAVADFSNSGSQVDLAAPGVDILSTVPTSVDKSGYAYASGTSMAAPQVSALAAVLKSQDPDLTNSQVEQIMKETAVDIGPSGKDRYAGYGRIDFAAAIQKLKEAETPEQKSFTLAELQADPATFHQLLTTYASSQIQVKDADGNVYSWQDLLKQSSTMAAIWKQDASQVQVIFKRNP